MTTHTRFHFLGVAVVLAYLLMALFAILLAGLLLFLLTHMVEAVRSLPLLLALLMGRFSSRAKRVDFAGGGESTGSDQIYVFFKWRLRNSPIDKETRARCNWDQIDAQPNGRSRVLAFPSRGSTCYRRSDRYRRSQGHNG